MVRIAVLAIAFLLTAGGLYGLYTLWIGTGKVADTESFTEEYELALQTYDGAEVRLSSYQNKPLVVFTYASWCDFCRDELVRLSRMQAEYGSKLAVIAVNRAESLAEAKAFTDQLGDVSNIQLLLDPEDAYFKSIEGYAMPETVFIESYGKVFAQHRGPMTEEQLRKHLSEMLRL